MLQFDCGRKDETAAKEKNIYLFCFSTNLLTFECSNPHLTNICGFVHSFQEMLMMELGLLGVLSFKRIHVCKKSADTYTPTCGGNSSNQGAQLLC